MNKYLGFTVIVMSIALFFLLQWLNVAVYLKFTVLIFGTGLGVVLLTVLPLLTQMKSLEQEEDEK